MKRGLALLQGVNFWASGSHTSRIDSTGQRNVLQDEGSPLDRAVLVVAARLALDEQGWK